MNINSRRFDALLSLTVLWCLFGIPVARSVFSESIHIYLTASVIVLTVILVGGRVTDYLDQLVVKAFFAYALIYTAAAVASYLLVGPQSSIRLALFYRHFTLLVLAVVYMIVGAELAKNQRSSSPLIALVLLSLYAVFNSASFSMASRVEGAAVGETQLNYQYFGDALIIAALISLTRATSNQFRVVILLLAVAGAFIVPSRSSAVIGTGCLALAIFLRPIFSRSVTYLIAIAAVGFVLLQTQFLLDFFSGTRFEELFAGSFARGSSFLARELAFNVGLDVIGESPLLGYWAFQVDYLGSAALYVHGVLDIWAQAGIAPFLAYVMFLWLAFVNLFDHGMRRGERFYNCMPTFLYAIVSFVVSRNPGYSVLYLAVGYAAFAEERQAL